MTTELAWACIGVGFLGVGYNTVKVFYFDPHRRQAARRGR